MQSRLRVNRESLRSEGVDYVDLWAKSPAVRQYRKRLKRIIEKDVVDEQRLLQLSGRLREIVLEETSSPSSLAVLSYENVLGGFDLTQSGAPYPNATLAIRHIIEAFPDCRVRIFVSVRSLDRFLESGYLQRVTSRRETRRFKQYLNQIDLPTLSWLPLVRAVESVISPEDIILWEYEKFFSDEPAIWNALLDRSDAEDLLVSPAKKSN